VDRKPLLYAIISAVLFGLSAPLSKLLLGDISATALAGLLYLGAFAGLTLYSVVTHQKSATAESNANKLEKKDWPWLLGATAAGGIVAPISLLIGLNLVSGFAGSLLLNMEGLCTALIAVAVFKENSGRNLWLALICMTAAGVFLSWDSTQSHFNIAGPLLILLATFCWGIDNNLTRHISEKNPVQITTVKGLIAGAVSLSLALILNQKIPWSISIFYALLLGAFSVGISLVFFIKALKGLGASRTGTFFSMGPFVGALASLVIFKNWTEWIILPAFIFMAAGMWFIFNERHAHTHLHPNVTHSHAHKHDDLHHTHEHQPPVKGTHTHEHIHPPLSHTHVHWPDTHHRHAH
jgi:drug/metabolite transporter (DMT)-like permease